MVDGRTVPPPPLRVALNRVQFHSVSPDLKRPFLIDRFWRILLKKSKIERLRKSREDHFLVVSAAARLCRAGTKLCVRICVNRCGPSRCRTRDAPGGLRNFVRQPQETFSTVSAQSGRSTHRRNLRNIARSLPDVTQRTPLCGD
jgi:hypothetical protein